MTNLNIAIISFNTEAEIFCSNYQNKISRGFFRNTFNNDCIIPDFVEPVIKNINNNNQNLIDIYVIGLQESSIKNPNKFFKSDQLLFSFFEYINDQKKNLYNFEKDKLPGIGAEGVRGLRIGLIYLKSLNLKNKFYHYNPLLNYKSNINMFQGQKFGKNAIMLEITYNNNNLYFINTHLPFIDKLDDQGNQIRKLTLQETLDYFKKISKLDNSLHFIFGDLNFRYMQQFQNNNYKHNKDNDQLSQYLIKDLQNYIEPEINFNPTCKLEKCKNINNYERKYQLEKKDKPRIPSWCDRIIYSKNNLYEINNIIYSSFSERNICKSDHNLIYGLFTINFNNKKIGGSFEEYYYLKYFEIMQFCIIKGLCLNRDFDTDNLNKLYMMIPDNTFGVFVSVERKNNNTYDTHGCIGYWDNQYNNMEKNIILNKIKQVSYSSTFEDNRNKNFKNSIYLDLNTKYKIYFMLNPIKNISNNGLFNDNQIFNNNIFGLIAENNKGNRATFLPGVFDFDTTTWESIKQNILNKSNINDDNYLFKAYHTKIIELKLIDYYIIPFLYFMEKNYKDEVPYSIKNDKINYNNNEMVRNLSTIYLILKLKSLKFSISENLFNNIINNINNINENISRHAKIYLMLIYDNLLEKIKAKNIYDYLIDELTKNFDNIEKNFELGQLLYGCLEYENKNNIKNSILMEKINLIPIIDINNNNENNIFRFNHFSKLVNNINDKNYKNKLLNKILEIELDINNETNYLAVQFEALSVFYKNNIDVEKKLIKLLKILETRCNKYGLYTFLENNQNYDINKCDKNNIINDNCDARIDITCHIIEGLLKLYNNNH